MNLRGKIIVLEGPNGAGKTVQTTELLRHLTEEGFRITALSFPQYDQPSSYFVRQYLSGEYPNINPFVAAHFYAFDRMAAAKEIKEAASNGNVIVINRFTGSNMAHQAVDLDIQTDRILFYHWIRRLEFEWLGIPQPDINIILWVPPLLSQELINQRGNEKDIHEKNLEHLHRSARNYLEIVSLFPEEFAAIDCVRSGKLLSIPEIHGLIWELIKNWFSD